MAVYRNDDDAARFRADQLERELAETKRALAATRAELADEIAKRPLKTNVALEALAIVGFIYGTIGSVFMIIAGSSGPRLF